jgi:predicted dehydrogenase
VDTLLSEKRVRWGILGCAEVVDFVMAPAIQSSRNGCVLAIASRSAARAQSFAERFDVPRSYGRYEELLRDPDVQAVYVPLPNSMHGEWTIRAAQAGKHVLCEKPLARNTREAREMVDVCRAQGVLLMEAFAQRFLPQNVLVKRLVDEGRIGKVLWMTSTHSSSRPRPEDIRLSHELAGGVLMDKGCYCVNTARFLMGAEPVSVFARAEFGSESRVDERMTATLHFPDDRVAQFDSSFRLEGETYYHSYELFGQTGRIQVPSGLTQPEAYYYGEGVNVSIYVTDAAGTEKIDCPGTHMWRLEAEYLSDRVLDGADIDFPCENGLANTKVIDALYASARENRVVTV